MCVSAYVSFHLICTCVLTHVSIIANAHTHMYVNVFYLLKVRCVQKFKQKSLNIIFVCFFFVLFETTPHTSYRMHKRRRAQANKLVRAQQNTDRKRKTKQNTKRFGILLNVYADFYLCLFLSLGNNFSIRFSSFRFVLFCRCYTHTALCL